MKVGNTKMQINVLLTDEMLHKWRFSVINSNLLILVEVHCYYGSETS
jgi:hypothetical protein